MIEDDGFHNAFETQDQILDKVMISDEEIIAMDAELANIDGQIKALRGLKLFAAATISERKLERLLQEKRDLLEG